MNNLDFTKVFPRVKEIFDEGEAIHYETDAPTMKLPEEDAPVSMPLTKNLVISFALDMDIHYQFVPNRDLSAEVTVEKLYQTALENMINELDGKVDYQGNLSEVIMFLAGGNYEAALMIWDELWENIEQSIGGPFYIAVPARDLLYLAPASNPKAIETLTQLINNIFDDKEAAGLMVRNIYERKNGHWEFVTQV